MSHYMLRTSCDHARKFETTELEQTNLVQKRTSFKWGTKGQGKSRRPHNLRQRILAQIAVFHVSRCRCERLLAEKFDGCVCVRAMLLRGFGLSQACMAQWSAQRLLSLGCALCCSCRASLEAPEPLIPKLKRLRGLLQARLLLHEERPNAACSWLRLLPCFLRYLRPVTLHLSAAPSMPNPGSRRLASVVSLTQTNVKPASWVGAAKQF